MKITEMLLTPNPNSRPQTPLKKVNGVVIHYVGNAGSSAMTNRNYFESLRFSKATYASSNYIIGLDGEILRVVPETEIAYCSNSRNSDTISIENCHPKADGKFSEATYKSLIELAADLCKRYKLDPSTQLIRHYDITQKACPLYYVNNPDAWEKLKKDVSALLNNKPLSLHAQKIQINSEITEIEVENINGYNYASIEELARMVPKDTIAVRTFLETLGYVVGYDDANKVITATRKIS